MQKIVICHMNTSSSTVYYDKIFQKFLKNIIIIEKLFYIATKYKYSSNQI